MLDAVVPLKSPARAKSRLRGVLDDRQRVALVRAMAGDLLALLCAHPRIASVTALLGEGWDEAVLRDLGVRVLPERELCGGDLNRLLVSALKRLRPRCGGLVVHADLPRVTAADIETLAQELDRHALVLCPDARRRGTNALAFNPGGVPDFCFGPHSLARHVMRARRRGARFVLHRTPGFAHDVDTARDLRALAGAARQDALGRRTRDWLCGWQQRAGAASSSLPPTAADPQVVSG